jgi:hypothetical protein
MLSRRGVMVARQTHNLKCVGSTPAGATTLDSDEERIKVNYVTGTGNHMQPVASWKG